MGLWVEQVHVSAAALAEAVDAAENLGRHSRQRDTVRYREMVWPVCGGHRVVGSQMRAHARRDGFLAGGQVHFTGYQPGADIESGFLVRMIFAENGFLEGTDQHHHPVQISSYERFHVTSSSR
jgi:hypothetical protein